MEKRNIYIDPTKYSEAQAIEITLEKYSLANEGITNIKNKILELEHLVESTGADPRILIATTKLLYEIELEGIKISGKIRKYEEKKAEAENE